MNSSAASPHTTYRAILGQVLRSHREASGLGQAEFAGRIGVTQPYWSKVERGAGNPSLAVLHAAASELGLTLANLTEQIELSSDLAAQRGVRVLTPREEEEKTDWIPLIAGAVLAGLVVSVLRGK